MAKVSVIVPVYNAVAKLATSLGNLVNQTLSDIEIILVNDCSTDDSLDILSDCEAQFSDKVILVNSDINRGAGGARNIGLMYASGEYIGFMDCDDIIALDMYEKLYNKAIENDYDIVDCGYYNEEKDLAIVHTSDNLTGSLNSYKRNELIVSGGYFWSKIFKKSFLDRVWLQFRENCILEDCETLVYLFASATSMGNVKEVLYNYKYYPTSLSQNKDPIYYYTNATAAITALYDKISALNNYDEIKISVEYIICHLCTLSIKACLNMTAPSLIIKTKLSTIQDYVKKMITIRFNDNQYIINKIKKEDILLVENISQLINSL